MSQQNYDSKDESKEDNPWSGLDIEAIASIDFGSFGFAAAYCPLGAPQHLRIVQEWADSKAATELNKNLAALLIDKKTKKTVAMGYDAEEKYHKAQEKKEDDKYMYFEHFKPYLYSKDHLEKNVPIPSADGQSTLPLADLITRSLSAVIQHTLKYINGFNQLAGIDHITAEQVFWVICVPAIWDEMSKEMMKHCAGEAGMQTFELGSEPIVSAFHVLNSQGKDFAPKIRDKIMILDCGGGTIDAACIEILSKQHDLSELHHGDGIRAGGLDVDKKFATLLNELLPTDIIDPIRTNQPAQWMRQKTEFVMSKFSCPLEFKDTEGWNVSFCYGINRLLTKMKKNKKTKEKYKNMKKHIEKYEIVNYEDMEAKEEMVSGSFKLGRTNLKINKKGWLHLHEEVLVKIVNFVKELFNNAMVSGCEKVIVVGGFARSQYLIDRLVKNFPKKVFFTPRQPHLAVVKGALYWICQRRKLQKTRAKYSYGIAIDRRFNPDRDRENRRKKIDGGDDIVENAFSALVSRNEEYCDGYAEDFDYWIPALADHLEIFLYASEDSFCQYVFNEDGVTLPEEDGKKCFAIKKFSIPINNPSKQRVQFQIKLEYNQNGINLSYIDPNDGEVKVVKVDTTAKPGSNK